MSLSGEGQSFSRGNSSQRCLRYLILLFWISSSIFGEKRRGGKGVKERESDWKREEKIVWEILLRTRFGCGTKLPLIFLRPELVTWVLPYPFMLGNATFFCVQDRAHLVWLLHTSFVLPKVYRYRYRHRSGISIHTHTTHIQALKK